MKRFVLASAALLQTLASMDSSALAGYITFAGLDRATVISSAGQTFTWTSDGETGTVTVRPVGSTQYLNPTVPNTANGRGPFSNFHTGVRSPGGSVDVSFEFLFSRPIDITIFNTETLATKELMTYQTDGDPWTGGWYITTPGGSLVGAGTQTVALSNLGPSPPHPYAALSSKGVTRFEYTNGLVLLPTQTGSIGNGIEIQIDAVGVPEPASISLVTMAISILLKHRSRRNQQCVRSVS